MLARILLLSLLLNLKAYRNALLNVLNQTYVAHNISVENVNHIAGNFVATNYISFKNERISPERQGNTKALHIITKCKSHIVINVLIDNGSSINVMLMSNLAKLLVDPSHIQQSRHKQKQNEKYC
ncbi:hypothetical protein REPUB_Repub03eG0130400 [Reevesia pubescens]